MIAAEAKKIRLVMSLRSAGIQDINVLNAIERVPREHFIPEALKPYMGGVEKIVKS